MRDFWNFGRKREAEAAANAAAEQSTGASYQENVARVTSQEMALRIASFYRCVSLRANTMAQLTCQYQRMDKDGGNFVQDNYGRGGDLNYLLQVSPNPMMTAFDLWRQAEIEVIMRGNAFILIERDAEGWPRSFWLAQCGGYITQHTFNLTWQTPTGPMQRIVDAADVIHIPNTFRSPDGLLGIPTLQYAADLLSLNKTLDNEALEDAAKGGKVKLILQQEKTPMRGLGGGLVKKQELVKYAQEVENAVYSHDVIGLHGITSVTPISMNAGEMQLFEQRQFGVAEICRMLEVPRSLNMDGSNSSYKTPEADRLDFLMNCIQPGRRLREDELNRKLLGRYDFGKRRIHLCELPLMTFDKKGQATIDKMNLETGAMTVNEIRKQYDMPSVPNGDIVYVSTNLAELGSKKLSDPAGYQNTKDPQEKPVDEGKEGDNGIPERDA